MNRRRVITFDAVRACALALPGVAESSHFAHPDFRVSNKIFATLPGGGAVVCLKTTAANLDALVAADPQAFQDEWRGRWLRVSLDRVTLDALEELILDAWVLVAPKSLSKPYLATRATRT